MAVVKLAEMLLRRKELEAKVKQVATIKVQDIFVPKVTRKSAHEGVDDIIASIPKLTLSQVTAEYDHYAAQLRKVDAMIQHANWSVEIDTKGEDLFAPWKEKA